MENVLIGHPTKPIWGQKAYLGADDGDSPKTDDRVVQNADGLEQLSVVACGVFDILLELLI